MNRVIATVSVTMAAGSALAHPGHGAETEAHWLTQPDHLVVLALGALAVSLGVRHVWRKRRKADA